MHRPRVALWIAGCSLVLTAATASAVEFRVALPKGRTERRIEGRLYVFLTQSEQGEPRFGPNWFAPEPFYRLDVADFAAGETRTVDDAAAGFPEEPSKLPAGTWRVQAVLDHDFYHQ